MQHACDMPHATPSGFSNQPVGEFFRNFVERDLMSGPEFPSKGRGWEDMP
jgi:hypothetical protein